MNSRQPTIRRALIPLFLALFPLRAAEPPLPFPELPALLAEHDEIRLLARFCPFLERLPADRLPALADSLNQGWKDEILPATHRETITRLLAERRATADPAALLESTPPRTPPTAVLAALRARFASDREAALAAFRQLATRGDPAIAEQFLAWLAESDPTAAFALLREIRPGSESAAETGAAMFRTWAARDPLAAWNAVSNFRPPVFFGAIYGAILANLALRDEPKAIQLWKSLSPDHAPEYPLQEWFEIWGRDCPDRSLALAHKFGTPVAWRLCAASLTAATPDKVFSTLLETAPPDMLEPALSGFFLLRVDSRGHRTSCHLPLLAKIPDPALRSKLIHRVVESYGGGGDPLPRSVADMLFMSPPELELPADWETADRFVEPVLRTYPEQTLAWLMRLKYPVWEHAVDLIPFSWPDARLGQDGPRLASSANPREAEVGLDLIWHWYLIHPADAFDYFLKIDPTWLADPHHVRMLADEHLDDIQRALDLAGRFPTAAQRDQAREVILAYHREHTTPYATTGDIRALLDSPAPDFPAIAKKLLPLVKRDLPEVDSLIERLPETTEVGDPVRIARGMFHLRTGRPDLAAALWHKVVAKDSLIQTIRSTSADQLGVGGAAEIISLLASCPAKTVLAPRIDPFSVKPSTSPAASLAQTDRDEAIIALYQIEVASGWAKALALAEKFESPDLRRIMIRCLAERVATPAQYEDLFRLAGDLPERKIASCLHFALARHDPVRAWREASLLDQTSRPGPLATEAHELLDDILRFLPPNDPDLLPALILEDPALAIRHPETRRLLIAPIARLWPAETYRFACTCLPEDLASIVSLWAGRDPQAACAATLTANPDLREARLALEIWSETDPQAALAWLLADPVRLCVAIEPYPGLLLRMAGADRAAAILSAQPLSFRLLAASESLADHLAYSDYGKAAAFLTATIARVRRAAAQPHDPFLDPNAPDPTSEQCLSALLAARREILAAWLADDPPAARDFIASLSNENSRDLPAMVEEGLFDDNPSAAVQFRYRRLAAAKGIPFALEQLRGEDDFAKNSAFTAIATFAVCSGTPDDLAAILNAANLGDLRPARAATIASAFVVHRPDGLLPWLRSLPDSPLENHLPDAVEGAVEAAKAPHLHSLAIAAVRILADHPPASGADTFPKVARHVLFDEEGSRFPSATAAVPLQAEAAAMDLLEKLDTLIEDLAAGRLATALSVAAALPSPEFDDLLCRILAAIPAADRPAALAAIPAQLRPRAAALAALIPLAPRPGR